MAETLPESYPDTRAKLHLVAARVLGAARYQAVGRFGLEVAPGGFATPEFDGRRIVVTGGALGDGNREHRLTSLGAACEFAGVDVNADTHPALQIEADADAATDVTVDESAARVLAGWYALCQDALERLAAACSADEEPTAITLWPEHFDVALVAGSASTRANYGGSPGDGYIAEPYLYVGPFAQRTGGFWNVDFGAALTFSEVRDGADPLDFLLTGRRELAAVTGGTAPSSS
jgi:hypothetical protein